MFAKWPPTAKLALAVVFALVPVLFVMGGHLFLIAVYSFGTGSEWIKGVSSSGFERDIWLNWVLLAPFRPGLLILYICAFILIASAMLAKQKRPKLSAPAIIVFLAVSVQSVGYFFLIRDVLDDLSRVRQEYVGQELAYGEFFASLLMPALDYLLIAVYLCATVWHFWPEHKQATSGVQDLNLVGDIQTEKEVNGSALSCEDHQNV